jgi:D-serine deaminase-like pyridoxal phosphate-dependent protein
MGYEAQIAGLPDTSPSSRWQNPILRQLKRMSAPAVAAVRAECVARLRARGLAPKIVNGAGTGNAAAAAGEPALDEITVGSGFLCGHLFDHYAALRLEPALFFALQAVRRPAPGMVTCHGGGYIASGAAGPDRLPRVAEPEGATLLGMEGAGEVQTPVQLPPGVDVRLGDPILFRPAKSGELAEHFTEYLLVRGGAVEGRAATYRGLGHCFLG